MEREEAESGRLVHHRLAHAPGAIRSYLAECEPGTAVAVEAAGNWYWIVGEIEEAGLRLNPDGAHGKGAVRRRRYNRRASGTAAERNGYGQEQGWPICDVVSCKAHNRPATGLKMDIFAIVRTQL